jgi:hypothetical protein
MGVEIKDLRDPNRSIHANWWQWRPTVELIRSVGLFDDERVGLLSDGFGEFTESETRQFVAALEQQRLPSIQSGQRFLLDRALTEKPEDGMFYRAPEEQHKNYSVDNSWLVQFIDFCTGSGGLYVC